MDKTLQCNGHFTVHPYRSHRLDAFCEMMSKDNTHVVFDDHLAKVLSDQGYSWDETPRSIYTVSKLYEALDKYVPGRIPNPTSTPELEQGIALARKCFARPKSEPKLRMLPFNMKTVVEITSNPTGSAGLTAWGCTKAEAMMRALERGHQVLHGVKKPEPCISFKRTQFNEKTRLVWGYPYAMTAIEGLIAKPLIEQFKDSSTTPMAFGMSTMKLGSRLRVSARHNRYAYSIDMSSFDASVSEFLIRRAFDILRTWYDLDQVEPETGVTCREVFKVVEDYFIHTPIVMPDHNVYYGKKHGVPSGSYFTQTIDSIANVIIAGTISAHFKMYLSKTDLYVLGDDLLMWSDRNLDLGKIASYASSVFGVKFNESKSEKFLWNDTIHYLGRDWDKGQPDQKMEEIIARMVFPEQFRVRSKDPEKKEREIDLLLASFASTYRSANRILVKRWQPSEGFTNRVSPNGIDSYVYDTGPSDINPEHLSGLQRFKWKYSDVKQGKNTSVMASYLA